MWHVKDYHGGQHRRRPSVKGKFIIIIIIIIVIIIIIIIIVTVTESEGTAGG